MAFISTGGATIAVTQIQQGAFCTGHYKDAAAAVKGLVRQMDEAQLKALQEDIPRLIQDGLQAGGHATEKE